MKSFIEKKLAPHNQNKRCKRKGKKCDNGNKDNCYFFFNLFIIIIHLFNFFFFGKLTFPKINENLADCDKEKVIKK